MEPCHDTGRLALHEGRGPFGSEHSAPGQEVAERLLRDRGGDERQLALRPVQLFPDVRTDDGQMPRAPLLHNISDDHRKGGDLDSLQAHANALTAAFSTNEARDESG